MLNVNGSTTSAVNAANGRAIRSASTIFKIALNAKVEGTKKKLIIG
jgi:hypothetical protein